MHDSIVVNSPPDVRGLEIQRVLSRFGDINGRRSEVSLVEAWKPRWRNRRYFRQIFTQVRAATFDEDHFLKYDVVFETVIPGLELIGVQVKTNYNDYLEFAKRYPCIPLVLVSCFDSKITLRKKSLITILHKFPQMIPEMEQRGCTVSRRALKILSDLTPDNLVAWI